MFLQQTGSGQEMSAQAGCSVLCPIGFPTLHTRRPGKGGPNQGDCPGNPAQGGATQPSHMFPAGSARQKAPFWT